MSDYTANIAESGTAVDTDSGISSLLATELESGSAVDGDSGISALLASISESGTAADSASEATTNITRTYHNDKAAGLVAMLLNTMSLCGDVVVVANGSALSVDYIYPGSGKIKAVICGDGTKIKTINENSDGSNPRPVFRAPGVIKGIQAIGIAADVTDCTYIALIIKPDLTSNDQVTYTI